MESFEQNNFIEPYTSLLFSLGTQASIIIQNAKLYEEITNLSTTDSLTGLSNRNHFLVELESNILKAKRYDRSLSCIIIDIDDFKMITDNYDHYIGDEIIKHVAVIIKNSVREVDIASRYGSEKFALILPETSYRDAVHVSERIKSDINKNVFYLNDTHIDITISCGIATYDDSIESVNELIKRADNARYKKQRTKKKLNT